MKKEKSKLTYNVLTTRGVTMGGKDIKADTLVEGVDVNTAAIVKECNRGVIIADEDVEQVKKEIAARKRAAGKDAEVKEPDPEKAAA